MPHTRRYDSRVSREQVNQLFEQSSTASAGAISAAVIMGAMLLNVLPLQEVSVWVLTVITLTLVRHALILRFRRIRLHDGLVERWKWRFVGLLLLSGIVWGASGVFLFPRQDLTHQMLILVVLTSMCAGAVATFSVVLPAYFAFTFPALFPIAINFLVTGDPLHYALGPLTLLFLLFMTMSASYYNRQARTVLSLKFENLDLVDYLETAKNSTDSANQNLKSEITRRKMAEEALQNNRKNLQTLVRERTAELQRINQELRKEIEERSRTEAALKISEEKYRLLVENANDAICILQEGRILFHNRRAETMLGYTGAEMREKDYFDLIHPDDRDRGRYIYLQRKAGRSIPEEYALRLLHRDDSVIWVQVNIIAMQWGDRPATQCIIRDITKQKHLEAQLVQSQKMDAIGKLAGGLAHDINNILGGIQGNISLLRLHLGEDHPEFQRIRDIESYIQSGSGLTRQILGFAQPGAPEIRTVDIDELLGQTVNMFCRTHREIDVHTDAQDGRKHVDIDSGQMEQVLLNLLINAWHAMPGGGSLFIETAGIEMDEIEAGAFKLIPGRYARIGITDTGTGIEEEILPRIFEPFFSTKPRQTGTGLGLSTVYTIIRNHRGHITVYSRPGRGTTFHIYLPLSERMLPETATVEEQATAGNETLLLVDDEPDLLSIGSEMLTALGYTVITAGNGQQAVAAFAERKGEIALVIIDMIMPGMDGEAVFDRVREIDPDVPVLLSSGYSRSGQAESILKKGCGGFIQKPFNLQTLSKTVRSILDALKTETSATRKSGRHGDRPN